MKPSLVVFDIAGTTLEDNDAVNIAFRAALRMAGVEAKPELVNGVMGLAKPLAIREILQATELNEPTAERIAAIHTDFVWQMKDYYAKDPAIRPVPGTEELFADLRKEGIKIALDTGFGADITDVILNRLGWKRKVDAWISSDEVQHGRPHPQMIHELMKRLNITDSRTICKVGDTPADLGEGTSANCRWVVGVTQGTHTREQLHACPHTHLIGTVAELPTVWKD